MLKKIVLILTLLPLLIAGCITSPFGSGTETNRDTVKNSTDDASITSKIKNEYITDIDLKPYQINVSTFNGNVVLTGSLPNEMMWLKAIEIAQMTNGVKTVNTANLLVAGR